MSYTVLARRYRSASFDDVVGQQHVAQTLKKAIETDRLAHAYLFCGTRGTGKTSMARILAKALNCLKAKGPTTEPCGKCDSCLAIARGDDIDVIEIDAASHTGVDNVREIIENSRYRPARSRFKVYIIDEVHMLSKSAFNALLKTLEEPPEHVKFILATTEPEKVLTTILSRCQRYDFRNISAREIAGHLKFICKQEKIEADEEALALVARAGAGSMRDSLSLLDRLLSLGEKGLTARMIEEMLGLPKAQLTHELVDAIGAGDVKAVLSRVDGMISDGLSADTLLSALSDQFRNLLILRTCGPEAGGELLDLPRDSQLSAQAKKFDPVVLAQDIVILEELRRNLRSNQTGRALMDATLVRLALADQFKSIDELLSGDIKKKPLGPVEVPESSPLPVYPRGEGQGEGQNLQPSQFRASPLPSSQNTGETENAGEPSIVPIEDDDVLKIWPRLIAMLKPHGSALAAGLSLASLESLSDGRAVIRFKSGGETFAKAWASNGKREIIGRTLSQLRGRPVELKFEVAPAEEGSVAAPLPAKVPEDTGEDVAPPPPPPPRVSVEIPPEVRGDPLVQAVLKEFGGEIIRCE
ncbi:MAG: DNA polymerase III subunit gamma/tau [Tepidisphaeraceae bacterium]|jgi:DNA polymerase-3 subunit gamma/tau